MNKFKTALIATMLIGALPLMAQEKPHSTGGNSPHETTSAVVSGNRVTVTYGRPYKKGREIFGKLEPYGKVYRCGADEATTGSQEDSESDSSQMLLDMSASEQ